MKYHIFALFQSRKEYWYFLLQQEIVTWLNFCHFFPTKFSPIKYVENVFRGASIGKFPEKGKYYSLDHIARTDRQCKVASFASHASHDIKRYVAKLTFILFILTDVRKKYRLCIQICWLPVRARALSMNNNIKTFCL